MRADPRNHCVPVIDQFYDPEDPAVVFAVLPFFRNAGSPVFKYVEEAMECVEQILEVRGELDGNLVLFFYAFSMIPLYIGSRILPLPRHIQYVRSTT